MYSTCLFCNHALGHNECLESFPVGRRLAYDAATARLWVICARCDRWNLSPFESRIAAIEDAERAFRAAKLRVATDNIALAKLRDGLELVRIGKPPVLELAAWRYGDQLRSRFRRHLLTSSLVAGAVAMPAGAAAAMGYRAVGFYPLIGIGTNTAAIALKSVVEVNYTRWRNRTVPVASVRDTNGQLLRVTQENINEAVLVNNADIARGAGSASASGSATSMNDDVADVGASNIDFANVDAANVDAANVDAANVEATNFDTAFALKLTHVSVQPAAGFARLMRFAEVSASAQATVTMTGRTALQALAVMLPATNRIGANQRGIQDALSVLSDAGNMGALLRRAWSPHLGRQTRFHKQTLRNTLPWMPPQIRLALEMSLHADDERRAMAGELKELERRWQDAEEIGRIADGLLLPEAVDAQWRALQTERDSTPRREQSTQLMETTDAASRRRGPVVPSGSERP